MNRLDAWDWMLLGIGAYVAVRALVKLMAARRQELTQQLQAEIRAEQERKLLEELKRKKAEAKEAQRRAGEAA